MNAKTEKKNLGTVVNFDLIAPIISNDIYREYCGLPYSKKSFWASYERNIIMLFEYQNVHKNNRKPLWEGGKGNEPVVL